MGQLGGSAVPMIRRGWITSHRLDYVAILVFGLTPLLWFREGALLNSEDLMVPPNWTEFIRFWFIWNDQVGTGAPAILDSGRFVTLFIAAALQALGVSPVMAQAAQFVFWFTLPGFAMYTLMASVYEGPWQRLSRLAAVLFYMFNLWLISNWMGYKEPMIAAVAVLPFALAYWIRTVSRDADYARAVCATGLVSILATPIGNNVTEMVAAMAVLPMFMATAATAMVVRRHWARAVRIGISAAAASVVWVAINAFWIVPELRGLGVVTKTSDVDMFRGVSRQFLEGQSLYTSLTNVVRLHGDWTWFQGLVDPYRTYAETYTSHPMIIFGGWVFVAVVITGVVLGRGRFKNFFVGLAGLGLVLGAGLNAPWGDVYVWVVEHVPGAWLFRSPWFKFTLFTVIGYAVLIGLAAPVLVRVCISSCQRMLRLEARRSTIVAAGSTMLFAVILGPVLAYPLTLGLFFATDDERTFLNPNHVTPPPYVLAAGTWLDSQEDSFRILSVPGDIPWLSDWGYSGFGSYIQWMTTRPVMFAGSTDRMKVTQGAPRPVQALVEQLESDLLDHRSGSAGRLAARLGIDTVVHERDVRYDFYQGTGYRTDDSPEHVTQLLSQQAGMTLDQTFGEWDVYTVDRVTQRFWVPDGLAVMSTEDARIFARLVETGMLEGIATVPADPVVGDGNALTIRLGGRDQVSGSDGIWVFDTSSGTVDSELVSSVSLTIGVGDDEEWGRREELTPGSEWRWVKSQHGPHFMVSNGSDTAAAAELHLRVFSYARDRTFYVYVNEELVSLEEVKADQVQVIRVTGVRLNPGENAVGFYTPFQSDVRDGENVAFAVEQTPQIGNGRFVLEPRIPASGQASLTVLMEPLGEAGIPGGAPPELGLLVNGQPKRLSSGDPGELGVYRGVIKLSRDLRIDIAQQGQEEYLVLLHPTSTNPVREANASVRVLEESPSGYQLIVEGQAPYLLVFNESFHPDWEASIDGERLDHIKVDGYANGFWVHQPGVQHVTVEFSVQPAFTISVLVSAISLMMVAIGWVVFQRRSTEPF